MEQMQMAVGGYIECAFKTRSPTRSATGHILVAYVNEEGLLEGLPRFITAQGTTGMLQTYAGNMVITAVEVEEGDTEAMTQDEVDYIVQSLTERDGQFLLVIR